MGIPDHLTGLLRNLYAGQEATVRTGHGTTDWFQIGKGLPQGCILSPCLFNFYAEYIMRNAGLEEAQAGIKIAGRNINNLRYADDTTLMVESEEELKSLLMKVKRGEQKSWLKAQHSENEDLGIWSHHFMANRWGNSVRLYFLGGSKITRRLYTWTSPDGQHRNQTDYILCSERWRSSIQSAKTRPGADCGSDHELLIAKFRLKLKKVRKTTRPFRYDLNQIPYYYTVEVRNRFKGLDLIECLMNYGMRFVTLSRRQGSRPSPWKRNAKKQNCCLGRPYK